MFIWGNNGYTYGASPEKHPLDVKAVNAATGEYLWVKNKAQPAVLVSTGYLASDVYFVGSLDGQVRAYDAENGAALWTSGKYGAVRSNLRVDDDMLIWGVGIREQFAGGPEQQNGLFAYRLAAEGAAAATGTSAGDAITGDAAKPQVVTEGITIDGDSVTIPRVVAEQDGYVVIHAMPDGQPVVP